ncbi:MAG: hypothetical protein ACXWJB_02530 [Limisphaerales bacterium]
MNRRYRKFAETIICGSAFFTLSICWSRATSPNEQVQPGTTISKPNGASYQSSPDVIIVQPGSTATYRGAPVDSSSSEWQKGQSHKKVVTEPSGAQPAQQMAPIENASSSEWQRGIGKRKVVHEPSGSARTQARSWQVVTASGLWQSGLNPVNTLGPDSTVENGWIPGDSNPDVVPEPSGANWQDNQNSWQNDARRYNNRYSNSGAQSQYQQQQYQTAPSQPAPVQQYQPQSSTQSGRYNQSTSPQSQSSQSQTPSTQPSQTTQPSTQSTQPGQSIDSQQQQRNQQTPSNDSTTP